MAAKSIISSPSLKTVLSAVKKLTPEERQLLRVQLFSSDILNDLKTFETGLKKKKGVIKKTDEEIVTLTNTLRQKRYANSGKMLY